MAARICTSCGYEGRGKPGATGSGAGLKVLGVLLMLPLYSISRIFGSRGGRNCPNCGRPTMVKTSSDAGRLAQQRMDIELGILKPKTVVQEQKETFGAQQTMPRIEKTVDPDQW